jgi:hypothetical protein
VEVVDEEVFVLDGVEVVEVAEEEVIVLNEVEDVDLEEGVVVAEEEEFPEINISNKSTA